MSAWSRRALGANDALDAVLNELKRYGGERERLLDLSCVPIHCCKYARAVSRRLAEHSPTGFSETFPHRRRGSRAMLPHGRRLPSTPVADVSFDRPALPVANAARSVRSARRAGCAQIAR